MAGSIELIARTTEPESVIVLFEAIAAAEGWRPGDQLRAHVDRSVYFGVQARGEIVGGLQLVSPDAGGLLPTHAVWPELHPVDPAKPVLHAAVLAVRPDYRGRHRAEAFWRLAAALWRHCVRSGVATVWLEATPKMLRCYRLLGWPLETIGEPRLHWGEIVHPCRLGVRDVAGSLAQRALTSQTYRSIVLDNLQPDDALQPA